MDCDLWGPPYDLGVEDSSFDNSQCDFYFSYGFDVMEEDALNEKYCLQVLRILIMKEDTEILELEQELLSLQSELAWVENAEWPDICCNALREKIEFLDISVENLRNKDKNDIEICLLMYAQPVETLEKILKALFRNYVHREDERYNDAIVLGSSSDGSRNATSILDKNKRLRTCNLEISTCEKIEDCFIAPATIFNSSLNLQEKKSGNLKVAKPVRDNFKDFSTSSSEVAPGQSDEKKSLSYCGPRSALKGETGEHDVSPKDKKPVQSSSSKSVDKRRHSIELVKVEPTDNSDSDSPIYALENATHSHKKGKGGDSDSTIVTDNVEENSSISTADAVISSSPSKPVAKKTNLRTTIKLPPACTVSKDFIPSADRIAAGHSSGMKILVNSDPKIIGNEDARELQYRDMGKSKTLNSSLNLERGRNQPRTDVPAGVIVKDDGAEALRRATAISGRKEHPDRGLDTSKQTEGSNSGVEKNLCKFGPKAAQKQTMTESKIAAAGNVVSLKLLPKTNGKKRTPIQIAKLRETDLTDTESCALTSLLEMQDQKGKNAAKLQPKEEEKVLLGEIQKMEFSADGKRSNWNLSLNPETEKGKRNNKSNPPSLHEIGFPKLILNSSSSSPILEGNKKRKSGPGLQNASLSKKCWCGKVTTTKKAVKPDKCEGKVVGAATDDNQTSIWGPQEKKKDDECCSGCESSSEVVGSSPCADIIDLNELRLAELRAIAGQLKLTKYGKLRKDVLLERIAERLANR